MTKSRIISVSLIFTLVVLWGVSFAIYKVALADSPPILFAGIRTLFGGLIVLCIALFRNKPAHLRKYFWTYFVSAVFNVFFFFGLQTVGLSYLPAGLFSVLIYLEPVLVGIVAWLWLGEPMSPQKIIGLILGFLGVAAISAHSLTQHLSGIGIIIGIATAVFWTFGTVYSKKAQERVDMIWLLAIQFLIGGVLITLLGSMSESWTAIHVTTTFVLATLFGGFFGITLSWMIWFHLVHAGEASRIAAMTFFVPLISVLTSVVFLHESLNIWLLVGLVLIVLGIYLTNRQQKQSSVPQNSVPMTPPLR
ncbi:DMT family transporter [Alicyclobacillus fastidiosus]|uniref:DMT family transporter n=1 Tax=Alicyclobacillus fastidiosus TaxID=392011 RepID=A0ABV5ADG3_9BACL|nr:DMT family transporter [Alicyclobacillus fastidiosus]WEH08677.1 DMT family transporter [Alicyclobacillus fastidiosus]